MKKFTLLLLALVTLMVTGFNTKAQTSVVDIVVNSENHGILETALTDAGLVGALQGDGPFTVFAPTDDAFAALLNELDLNSLDEIDSLTLVSVLQMHVVSGKVMSTDLTEGMKAGTLEGDSIMFSLEDGAKIMDPNGRVSNITTVDLEADNGVVHVIDTVILPDQRPETVVEIATGDDAFSTLVAALTRSDLTTDFVSILSGEGPFTVFAPTNDAFADLLAELGVGSLAEIPVETLDAVLKMHVVSGKVMSTDLSEGLSAATLYGEEIMFSLEGGAKIMDPNDRTSNITAVDVEAQNGVVHVIDKVILPDQTPATVVDIATGDDAFSTLVAALTRSDLTTDFVSILSGEGPFTVFAPTNDAFADLLAELGVGSLAEIPVETLDAVLKMHVVSGKVMSTDLSEGLSAATLYGEDVMFSLEDGAKIMDPNDRTSNITAVDVEAQNGVVHVIDKVILPDQTPATVVDIATGDDAFSTLVAALTREDLTTDFVGVLTGDGPFTVFAPTNDAFADLLAELGVGSLAEIPVATLEAVLKMHVLNGKVMSTDLSEGLTAETLQGEDITFSLEGGATITDLNRRVSNITAVDVEARNGVVHVVDKVILPDMRPETVVDVATGSDSFDLLVAMLQRNDLTIDFIDILSGEGPFTVFAPTDEAFADLVEELGVPSLSQIPTATLEAVLQAHVISGRVFSGDLMDGMKAETLLGDSITFYLEGGAKLMDPNGRMSNITAVDIEAKNGVVHVIDKVILPDQRPETVVDIATSNDAFSILVAALTRSDLTVDFVGALNGEGPFTVFAPTNDAFAALLAELGVSSLEEIPTATLEAVLQMHVLNGKVMSTDLSEGLTAETLLGEEIMFSLEDGAQLMDPNGRVSNITAVDIEAQNGVVHVIDTVILPNQLPETVVDIATSNDAFSILVAALTRSDLTVDFVGALTGEGPFTVFAPTNDAFAALLAELGVSSLEEIPTATLEAVLQMHVLNGKVMSTDLSEGLTAETLLGEEIMFSLENGAQLMDPNGRVSNITAVDIEAQNGVVHVIDTVILPNQLPETVVDIATSNDAFSILVAALTRSDLTVDFVGALTGEGPFTVFAPTNDAFAALLAELGVSSLEEIPTATLEAVLQMHVLNGKVMSTDLSEGLAAETLLGEEIMFSLENGAQLMDPNGRVSNITAVDIEAQNGVVHVIDTVILPNQLPETVVDIATSNDAFSILVAALTRSDLTVDFVGALTGEGPFTVFAPTNDAFAALLAELGVSSLEEIPTATLEAVLQMHVLNGKVMSTDLSEGLTAETLLGEEIMFSLEDGAQLMDPNGRVSNITAVDIEAQNGVVHVIDTVILPNQLPETVVDIATSNDAFSILVAALTRSDLTVDFVGALTGEGPFTVFAPTNDAFAALLAELGVSSLEEIPTATLEAVLQMHVLNGKVMSTDLSEGLTAETLLGEEIMFSLENGAQLMDPNGRVSNITAVDIEAQNGVVHVIDTVILPEQTATNISEFENLTMRIYPNPASDYIYIESQSGSGTVRILDITGKTYLQKNLESSTERFDLTRYNPGLYFISVQDGSAVSTRKLIVR